jgi:4-hydroxy-3-methylbut-2-en-1-yl diphosphate reductase
MAEDILDEEGKLFCLGDIVHNDVEVKRLEAKGLRIISHDDLQHLRSEKVLIRAHGEPPSTYRIAIENDLTLLDASCPVVLKLQNRIRQAADKEDNIYIYGKHGHAEVVGLLGQTGGKATVFQSFDELEVSKLPKNITLFSQTTKSTDAFYDIRNRLVESGIEVTAYDTICRQVSNRGPQLEAFAARFDKVVFVAGTKSSNGKVLYNVCRTVNEHTYFISNVSELDASWFSPNDTIGICGATSTPMWLMEEVRDAIKKL